MKIITTLAAIALIAAPVSAQPSIEELRGEICILKAKNKYEKAKLQADRLDLNIAKSSYSSEPIANNLAMATRRMIYGSGQSARLRQLHQDLEACKASV